MVLGLDGAASHDGGACWLEAEDVGTGDRGVEAFSPSPTVRWPRLGEDDRMTTGQRSGDRVGAESVESTLDGELDAPKSPDPEEAAVAVETLLDGEVSK